MPIIALAIILAAALGGGVSVAANSSLPGDALYGFKTGVNENVESAFAFSAQDKANVDISLAQERMNEAQKLAAKGKLDAKAQAELSENFTAHAQDVSRQVNKMEASGNYQGAADVAAKFQGSLSQASSAMSNTSATTNTTGSANGTANANAGASDQSAFMAQVRSALNAAATLSTDASAKASNAAQTNGNTTGSTNGSTSGSVNGGVNANGSAQGTTGTSTSGSVNGSAGVKVNL